MPPIIKTCGWRPPQTFTSIFRRDSYVLATAEESEEFERLRVAQHTASVAAREWSEEEYVRREDNLRLRLMGIQGDDGLLRAIQKEAREAYEAYDVALRDLREFAERVGVADCSDFAPLCLRGR